MKPAAALNDQDTLDAMKAVIRQHLNAALIECAALARELDGLDPDDVMADLRRYFDPMTDGPIQDAFSDAFTDHVNRCRDVAEPLRQLPRLASGAV